MRRALVLALLTLQAGLLMAAPGQRKITGDGSIRETAIPGREAPMELLTGTTVSFTIPRITQATLFNGDNGFFVRVPAGATELRLQLSTTSDIDLYARFGVDVGIGAGGVILADHSTELIPSKDLRIGLSGSPGLRAGTYYVAVAAFDITAPNTGTITVTITGGTGGGGGAVVNDLVVTFGTEDNSGCPATKRLPITIRDTAGTLVSGFNVQSFSLSENNVQKNLTWTCPSAGQCVLGYTPANPNATADVEVKVNLNLTRTGSARKTVGACTTSGGGGGGGGGTGTRTATGLTLDISNSATSFGGNGWTTLGGGYWTLGVSQPDAAAGLLNAANRSVNLSPGTYFLYGEPGSMGSNARLVVDWSDGTKEEAIFATAPLNTTTAWTRLSGPTTIGMASTGLTSLNKVAAGSGITAGGAADFVFRVDLGNSTGGGGGGGTGGGTGTGCPSSTNIALQGTASQINIGFSGPPNLGNNGVLNEPNGYGFHTDIVANPWWQVDFGSVRTICEVRLHNRADGYFDRARSIRVLISTNGTDFEAVYSHNGTVWGETGAPLVVPIASRTARFVRVQLPETNYLHLREVEVFGSTSSGGGGSTGTLTVNIGSEDNTACPVTKKLIVSVLDSTGLAVTGLNSSNFTLTENGAPRPAVVSCSSSGGGTSAGSGAVVAIVIDTSGSLSSTDLANEKTAAVNLVNSLGASDQVAVYNFDSGVTKKQAFTTNKQLAITAINSLAIGGSTALYQALHLAATEIAAVPGRRAIVLMTDGGDNQGGKTIDEAINAAKAAQAPVYAVGFGSGINETVMRRMGTETGGTFTRGATSAELQALLQTVATNITSTCEISYTPVDPTREADIRVSVTAGTRTGAGTRRVAACTGTGGGGGGTGGGGGGGSTTGPGWTVTQGCNYFVTPLAATPVAAQSTGIIRVTTADNCEWNAHSEVSWVRVTAVRNANGKGSGAVDYIVSANPDPVTRTGRVITAGQIHNVTQAAGASCAITLSPTTARVGPGAGSSTLLINATTTTCAWTGRSNDSWLKITGTTGSGTGTGRISYTWDANATTAARNATMTVNGQTFTLTQDAGSIPGTPTVTEAGIVNSASGIPPSLPGGALAQGSFFTIFAAGVGPTPPQQVEQFPLPTLLGGTQVQIRQGSRTVDCYLVYTSSTQINGIIPSNAPLGDAEMIVTYSGRASRPVAIRVARNNFGIFATSQGRGPGIIQNFQTQLEQPLNTRSATAKPRQVIILWGTGAGPISAPDNQAPPAGNLPFPFEMTIGGKTATLLYNGRAPCCAGVDQIVAEVPADAPQGCFVPVQVKAGDVWSNVVSMAIEPNGQTCKDATNPASTLTSTGGKVGIVMLTRLSATVNVTGQPEQTLNADAGIGAFTQMQAGGDLGFNMLTSFPPAGSCQAYAGVRDVSDLLGGALGGPLNIAGGGTMLDAGTALRVASGGRTANLDRSENGMYVGILGGNLPLPGSTTQVPLDAGAFTISGTGGKDVGAFTSNVTLRPPITWTNRGQISSIDRKTPFTMTWTGGTAGEDAIILGYGTDQKTKASSGFVCVASAPSGSFTVPASAMANLPAVPASGDLSDKFGLLGIFSLRTNSVVPFTATGIDIGMVLGAQIEAKTIEIR